DLTQTDGSPSSVPNAGNAPFVTASPTEMPTLLFQTTAFEALQPDVNPAAVWSPLFGAGGTLAIDAAPKALSGGLMGPTPDILLYLTGSPDPQTTDVDFGTVAFANPYAGFDLIGSASWAHRVLFTLSGATSGTRVRVTHSTIAALADFAAGPIQPTLGPPL